MKISTRGVYPTRYESGLLGFTYPAGRVGCDGARGPVYQHATVDRDKAIAESLDRLMKGGAAK